MGEIKIHTSEALGGVEITKWSGLQIVRTIDSGADAFSFSTPWEPTEQNKNLFKAYRPIILRVFHEEEQIIEGRMENLIPRYNSGERTLEIQGRGLTGTLIDSSAGPPFEFVEPISSNDIARKISIGPEGQFTPTGTIRVTANPSFTVPNASIEPGQSIFDFLSKLASARNLFALPQPDGSLLFSTLDSGRASVVDIQEGKSPLQSIETNHDVTKRFYQYVVIQDREGYSSEAEAIDSGVDNRIRWRRIVEPEQATEDITQAAQFAKARALAESYRATATVTGWEYAPGKIWRAGDIVRVLAPSAMIYNSSRLIIRRATLQMDESGGKITQLELALPELYDGTAPKERPWAV